MRCPLLLLRQDTGDGVDVVAVTGCVGDDDAQVLVTAVEEVLQRHPRGVVVDLCEVTSMSREAAEALRGLSSRAPGVLGVSVCLHGSGGASALVDLPMHATRAQALAQVHEGASVLRQVVHVEHSVQGPRQARRAMARCAAQLGLEEAADDLLLVVSEMVTNAVRHGAPPVRLEVSVDDEVVVVCVADGSMSLPTPRTVDDDAEGGRGMTLVDLLTRDHGVLAHPPGKTVWASVRRRPAQGTTP